jgi:hypothetical protein
VDVVDATGAVLSTHEFPATGADRGQAAWVDLVGAVPWDERGVELAFRAGGAALARLPVGAAPEVDLAEPGVRSGVVHSVWVTRHPRQRPRVVVLYSADDGTTWQPVAFADGDHGHVEVPTDAVPGGPRCRLRVVASAELASTGVTSAPFAVPVTPRTVAILAPTEGTTVTSGVPVPLAAAAYSADFGAAPAGALHWMSDVDGELGYGWQLDVPLSPGGHRLTATAPDGTGATATASVVVTAG